MAVSIVHNLNGVSAWVVDVLERLVEARDAADPPVTSAIGRKIPGLRMERAFFTGEGRMG